MRLEVELVAIERPDGLLVERMAGTAVTERMAGAAVTEQAARRAEREALDGKPASATALGG